ncbi:EI24 domain-containing protein [Desulfolithobacter sp.]
MVNHKGQWIPLTYSIAFLFRHIRLLGWSTLLVAITAVLTWIGYLEAIHFIDGLTGHFFQQAPDLTGIWGWLVGKGWLVVKYLFLIITRIAAFYLAFLAAYCLTTPGYVFLSGAAEKVYLGRQIEQTGGFTPAGVLIDLWEGCKIGAVGILVTMVALAANCIPVVGQVLVFLIYVFYSALMFIDYPASSQRWTLAKKIDWVRTYRSHSFRLGIFPALISMIPVVNIFLMALLFPLFTIHTTLNFLTVQTGEQPGIKHP